ncbi:MAG: hypothetical protein ABSH56_17150 [Bryobacteraceae bacterium]|jgi:hypothetical protein
MSGRGDFLQQSAATGAWYQRPMRRARPALAENDPGNRDPHLWLDYLSRTPSDTVT